MNDRTNVCSQHSGFILIEFLVVISIISILATTLFPALKIKCVNNLRTWGQILPLCDYDGELYRVSDALDINTINNHKNVKIRSSLSYHPCGRNSFVCM